MEKAEVDSGGGGIDSIVVSNPIEFKLSHAVDDTAPEKVEETISIDQMATAFMAATINANHQVLHSTKLLYSAAFSSVEAAQILRKELNRVSNPD